MSVFFFWGRLESYDCNSTVSFYQPRLLSHPPTLRRSHAVTLLKNTVEGGVVTEAAGSGGFLGGNSAQEQIAGAIQADVQDIVPQGDTKPCLDQGVCMDSAVVKDLANKGKIPYLGVVTGDLIRQRALARRLLGKAVIFSVDGRSVCKDLT